MIPSRLLWTNTQHSLISLVGRLSILSSCVLCLVIETPIRIDEPKMPVRPGGHIAFFSLCCRPSNSLCGPPYWSLLSRRYLSTQIHKASCQLQQGTPLQCVVAPSSRRCQETGRDNSTELVYQGYRRADHQWW